MLQSIELKILSMTRSRSYRFGGIVSPQVDGFGRHETAAHRRHRTIIGSFVSTTEGTQRDKKPHSNTATATGEGDPDEERRIRNERATDNRRSQRITIIGLINHMTEYRIGVFVGWLVRRSGARQWQHQRSMNGAMITNFERIA